MDYQGVVIEESLADPSFLKELKIIKTEVEKVTPAHQTPYLKQWTLHTVIIPQDQAEEAAQKISQALEVEHSNWYADFSNSNYHYIIFPNKVFKIDKSHPEEYGKARDYGISLGIPEYQVNFS